MGSCVCPKGVSSKNVNLIEDENNKRQYMVTVNLMNEGENILVITSHPRRVNNKYCNKIIKRIIRYLSYKHKENFPKGIQRITVVNILSNYDVDNNQVDFKNLDYILKGIQGADIIVAAWGKPKKEEWVEYTYNIASVLKQIRYEFLVCESKKRFLKVGKLTREEYPKHVLAWKYNDELSNYYN